VSIFFYLQNTNIRSIRKIRGEAKRVWPQETKSILATWLATRHWNTHPCKRNEPMNIVSPQIICGRTEAEFSYLYPIELYVTRRIINFTRRIMNFTRRIINFLRLRVRCTALQIRIPNNAHVLPVRLFSFQVYIINFTLSSMSLMNHHKRKYTHQTTWATRTSFHVLLPFRNFLDIWVYGMDIPSSREFPCELHSGFCEGVSLKVE